ncbi:MAG: RcnB family protein [Sphingomonas sp.]|uniref:RcnB family protein n=1 Tax=Sphingomonas sp. TaxID=28214 RepID=UPI001ACA80D5|nr:RcnB family protein [Sphingomonas sp.]MBN8809298.1 RcnB family protein [Sphingomonas sp.]
MRTLILTALVAATVLPVAAQAQSYGDIQRDRRDIRQDRRDLREDQRDYRQDMNRRWGDNDWRGWRDQNRGLYARGNWRAPFRYYAFRPGVRIAPVYYGGAYVVADPWRYRLPPAGYGQRWVRHYDDLLLVDMRRGIVVRVINHFYW